MKKVIIEKAPKKKVVIEGLPEAALGTGLFSQQTPFGQQFGKAVGEASENFKKEQKKHERLQRDLYSEKKTPSFKFTGIDLAPISGNPYLQKGMNYLSRGLNKIPGIMEYSKTGKISEDNLDPFYSGSMYTPFISEPETINKEVTPYYDKKGKLRYRAEGGYLPIAQNALNPQLLGQNNQWGVTDLIGSFPGYGSTQQTPTIPQSVQDAQPLNVEMPAYQVAQNKNLMPTNPDVKQPKSGFRDYTKGLVQASPAIDALAAGYQFGKGALDMMGSNMQNKAAQAREADMYTQAVFSDAMNVTPYETQGYGFSGRNALAADGMQIRQIGGMGEPNVEVEGREHIKLPNGFSQEIQGKSHAQGGIPLNLPQGTQIFSEKLKDPQTKKSYADLAKKFETKKYVDLLNSKSADSIQMTTAQMMIAQNTAKLEKIFMLQEQNKISGVHGPQVQQKAMQEQQQAMVQQQQEQAAMQEPMMAHGGRHLPKFQNAGQTGIDYSNWRGQTFKTAPGIVTPQGVNLNVNPLADWARFAKRYGPLDKRITQQQTPEAIAALQENIYDDYLDTEHGREALSKMWQDFGVTNKMEKDYAYISKKIKNKEKLSLDDLNRLRGNYIDSLAGKRLPEYLEPRIYTPNIKGPTSSAPEETTPPTPETITKYVRPEIGLDMAMGIPLPEVYGRDPLNYYKIEPTYIDPRYLDIQPQLNEITRGQRALQSNIGSRGSADMANLLQAQANAAAAQQQAFGQKYNYDRAQDAAAQQFNAQAKAQADQFNQQSWFQQLEDPIRRREGMMDTQRRTDAQQELENARRMQAFYANKGYIDDTFYPLKNMTGEQIAGFFATPQGKQYLQEVSKSKKEETETEEQKAAKAKEAANASVASNKYGGRLRIKPKLKGKFRK